MDEWIALLAQKINPESTQHILTQIYVMLLASHPWLRFSGEHRWCITEMAMAIGEIEALRSIETEGIPKKTMIKNKNTFSDTSTWGFNK